MEFIIVLECLFIAVLGGLSFATTIQRLKKRIYLLEQKEALRQEIATETTHPQNIRVTLSAIDLATQQAVQQVETAKQQAMADVNLQISEFIHVKQEVEQLFAACRHQLTETVQQLETHQRVLEPPAQQLLDREQQIDLSDIPPSETVYPVFSVEPQAAIPPIVEPDFTATLTEMSFETAFIENHLIRREYRTARQLTEYLPNGVVLELVYLPGGTFIMGSEEAECATPPRSVSLKPFLAGKYPITQAQWEAVMDNNPSKFRGAQRPVEMVNWRDAVRFCAKLSQLTGVHYQLLTEARWEYACRAGSVTRYSFGDVLNPELANYEDSGMKQTSEVGIYPANAFGLYDMHGNVWEWCEDTWHDNYVDAPNDGTMWDGDESQVRLLRGGSWYNAAQKLQSATRIGFDVSSRYDNEGFRVMRLLELD